MIVELALRHDNENEMVLSKRRPDYSHHDSHFTHLDPSVPR